MFAREDRKQPTPPPHPTFKPPPPPAPPAKKGESLMATIYPHTATFIEALRAEGFELPKHCVDVTLEVGIDSAYVLHYRKFLDADEMTRIGRALERVAKEQG